MVTEQDKINDGGERISYGDGMAIREPTTGKGRYDLISPFAIRRLAKHYENGSRKYTTRIEISEDDLISAIKKELEKIINVPSVVSINYIAKECAGVATKNHCAKEIWTMFYGKERTLQNGTKNTQNGLKTQQNEEEKIPIAEKETSEQREDLHYENVVLQKKRMMLYTNGKMKNVQSVEDLSILLEQSILTMTIQQGWQEVCYVVDATTDSECLKNLLTLCKKLYPIFAIQQQQNSYILEIKGDRNWEKGMPFSRYIDSAKRHIDKFIMGMDDEDHLAAAAWNIFAIMHHQELGQYNLDDMPHYLDKDEVKDEGI